MATDPCSSGTLLARMIQQERPDERNEAWREWYESPDGKALRRHIKITGLHYGLDVEELEQDTLFGLTTALSRGMYQSGQASLLTFAKGIARNQAYRALAAKKQALKRLCEPGNTSDQDSSDEFLTPETILDRIPDPASGPEQLAEVRELFLRFKRAFAKLSEREQLAIELAQADIPGKEAALKMGVSHGAFRQILLKARLHLTSLMNNG